MKNNEYIEEFLIYEKKIKALSDNTVKAYNFDLDILSSFSGERELDFPSFSNVTASSKSFASSPSIVPTKTPGNLCVNWRKMVELRKLGSES